MAAGHSIGVSQIRLVPIQHASWNKASVDGQTLPWIFASAWLLRLRPGRCRVTRPRRNSALASAHGDYLRCGARVRPQRCVWQMSGRKPTAISGEYRALVAGARQGRGLRLAWACRRTRRDAQGRSSGGLELRRWRAELKKIVAAGERDRPEHCDLPGAAAQVSRPHQA